MSFQKNYDYLLDSIENHKLKTMKEILDYINKEENYIYFSKHYSKQDHEMTFNETPVGKALSCNYFDIANYLLENPHPYFVYKEEIKENLVDIGYVSSIFQEHKEYDKNEDVDALMSSGVKPRTYINKKGKRKIKQYYDFLQKIWTTDDILSELEKPNCKDNVSSNEPNFGWSVLKDYFMIGLYINRPTFLLRNLLKKGLPVNSYNENGDNSLLMMACRYADLKSVKLLLRKGADVNWKDPGGMTPLQMLITIGSKKYVSEDIQQYEEKVYGIVDALFEYKADPYIKDYQGKTILDRLNNHKNKKLVAYVNKKIIEYSLDNNFSKKSNTQNIKNDTKKESVTNKNNLKKKF